MTGFLPPRWPASEFLQALFLSILLSIPAAAPARAAGAPDATSPRPLLTLLTDFGNNDFYVPTLKGAIYSVDPNARIVDLTHEVVPFDVREAAFLLAESSREFPAGTIFVGIVDPGVGTDRKPIAIRTRDGSYFVGPDNGILIEAAELRGIAEVREIRNRGYQRRGDRSSTFHGRDLFGPAGASLGKGMPFEPIGPRRETWVRIERKAPSGGKGKASGEVLHADSYGNLLTNLTEDHMAGAGLRAGKRLSVHIGGASFDASFVETYASVPSGERLVTVGSTGRIEIAINEGNLAETLGVGAGQIVSLVVAGTVESGAGRGVGR
ncbi:MAG: SAM-dependent chlorinase/fluorinase [Deltaproteobacteria bacterium]|nr:SAM-dependent chlorinase/fluorinase [Deltaproteobacteria bacterium]